MSITLTDGDLLSFSSQLVELDPRIDRCKIHSVESIVFITLAGVLSGADSWNSIEDFGKSKESFFRCKIPDFAGVPSHDTISRFFCALNPVAFESCFRNWVSSILENYTCSHSSIAIDGKTICGGYASELEQSCRGRGKPDWLPKGKLHMVSAYLTDLGISLGQVKVADKSNEITAIPELLDALDIKGNVISIDAMGCQKSIARKIIEEGGDYFLFVKNNQPSLKRAIQTIMPGAIAKNKAIRSDRYQTKEKGHGRIETRTCYSYSQPYSLGKLTDQWKGVSTVGYIETQRQVIAEKKPKIEKRYFISSLGKDAKRLLQISRAHWKIENGLHWQLDVTFKEDATRKKNVAAQNFSLICKMALTILKTNKRKIPINRKRMVAGWDNEFLWELLTQKL